MSGLPEVLDPGAHLVAAVLYALAFVLALFSRQTGDVPDRGSKIAGAAGLLVHLTAIAGRWIAVGHGPFVTMYEDLSAYSAVVAAIALYLAMRGDGVERARVPMYPVAFLMLGVALYSGPQTSNLPPTFSGIWLVLHVCFYFLAFGTAVTAGASSVLVLRAASRPADSDVAAWERFDALAYRYAGLAFAFWGVGMLSGAVWAFNAWGRYWGWDPVETWSLITWLMFGVYLHLRRFFGWKGRRAAVLLAVCLGLAVMSLFGTTALADSLHSVYFQ